VKRALQLLASMKFAIGILVALVIALAAGTIVESYRGTDAAILAVYGAGWFRGLLALFALNLAASLAWNFPWGKQRIGFVMTHVSMLVILAGALATEVFKVEGSLALWEGEESAAFLTAPAPGSRVPGPSRDLPFRVKLESFEIDTYPGTQRPAMFRSRVVVTDPAAAKSFPAVIEMNRELSYAGYRLFQSSYERTPGRDRTILSVSRDPGQGIVFAGYTLLLLGMTTVLGTRIAQRRAAARITPAARPGKARRAAAILMVAALAAGVSAGAAGAATVPDSGSVERLRSLPVQHDGRVMPLDTLAREAVWNATGGDSWGGTDPVALVLGWALYPDGWAAEPMFPLDGTLADAIGTPGERRSSFLALARNQRLLDLFGQARAASDREQPLSPLMKKAQKLEGRLIWMQRFLNRDILRVVPPADELTGDWSVPPEIRDVTTLLALADSPRTAHLAPAMQREITHNRIRPARLSWWVLAAASAVGLLALVRGTKALDVLAAGGLVVGFGVMSWGIWTRWEIAGRIPASNMYESMLFLGWGVGLFALVAAFFLGSRLVFFNAAAMSALTMALCDLIPIDPFVHPVPPVLAGTVWLAIHVPIIMVSYSVLALGVLAAHLQIGFEVFAPRRREWAAKMHDLLYWYIHVGSILLIAGILTGSVWAASSWGRYWGWDPKEVWSLVAFLAYLAILHGRLEKFIGGFGVALASIVAFWAILFTYVGVNFILTAGLHSYGFGDSSVVRWLAAIAAAEAIFLGFGAMVHSSRRAVRRMAPAAS
jgi:cytochrome c-type biogenesis protein CcsB